MLGANGLARNEDCGVTCHDSATELQWPPTMAALFCVIVLPAW
jgi:hypothetical protein